MSWTNTSPTTWVFKLRQGVKFHDGTPFTADDVVFSFNRARESTVTFRLYSTQCGIAKKIDDYTVEFTTPVPNPVMLDTVRNIMIMSKAWSEKNGVTKPLDYIKKGRVVRHPQRDGYRAVQVGGVGAGRENPAQEEPRLVGREDRQLHRQYRNRRLSSDLERRHAHGRTEIQARSILCSILRCRMCCVYATIPT